MFVGDSKNGTVSIFNILPNKRLEKTQLVVSFLIKTADDKTPV